MATTAKNRDDVENMSARDRLWDSLSNAYGNKTRKSNEEFAKAYSKADRQLVGRGMQRSSYGAQTLANIDKQRIDAANDIESELIADYENRLSQLDQQEAEAERWERQFAESQRQYDTTMEYNKERAATQDQQWQTSFDYNKEQADRAYDYQVGRDAVADKQWQKTFDQEASNYTRSLAASYAQALLSADQPVPQSLLDQAGLSIIGGQVVIDNTPSSGGGYYGGGGSKKNNSTSGNTASTALPEDFRSFANSVASALTGGSKINLVAALDAQATMDKENAQTKKTADQISNSSLNKLIDSGAKVLNPNLGNELNNRIISNPNPFVQEREIDKIVNKTKR